MDGRSDTNEWAAAGAVLPVGGERRDDRLDAALAFLLAFGVLGSVWWYAAQPLDASPWPVKTTPAASAQAPVMPATPAEAATPVPVPRSADINPDTTAAPLAAAAPEVAAPVVVAPAVAAVVAPIAAAPVVAAPAPVVVAPEPPVVAAVQAPVASAAPAPAEPAAPAPKVIVRENFQFAVNQAVVPESAQARLDEIAKILAADPRSLKIAGHSDASGPRGANVALSLRRAQAVREYLVSKGVPEERLKAVGFGPDQPIASNRTEEGRAKNRRIDITE